MNATEGWLYALISAAIGAIVGIQLGRLIAWRADQILDAEHDLYALDLTFAWTWETVAQGFAIGLVIGIGAIMIAMACSRPGTRSSPAAKILPNFIEKSATTELRPPGR